MSWRSRFSRRSTHPAMPTKFVRALPIFLASLVVGLTASPAAATFGAPFDLSAPGQDAGEPQVAVDAAGDAVFTWQRFDGTNLRVQARARSAAGVLSPVRTLSDPGQDGVNPQVGVDADGDAVFTWMRFDGTNYRVQARARSAAGVLSPVRTLSDPGQDGVNPQVGVDADGDAVVTWDRGAGNGHRVQARARSAAGVLGPVRTLSGPGVDAVSPRVGVDADGDAVFTWTVFDGTNPRVQARARSAAGVLSPVRTLSALGVSAFEPRVGVDADGDAVVTWYRFDGTDHRVQARARSAAGVLGPVRTLSDPGVDAYSPQVGVDADGDAVFTWYGLGGTNWRVQARARTAAGVLGPVRTLSASGVNAFDPQVGVDADGDAVVTWERDDGANLRVQARARSAAGVLGPVQTLSGPAPERFGPQVAVDAAGDAVVAWQRFDGTNYQVQGAVGP